METEKLKIFNEARIPIGVASREEIHKKGYWHEVFHCWFFSKYDGKTYIYLQLRSPVKKDYPNLYDITAAGHLLSNETVEDGIREVKEELGISVDYKELTSVGLFDYEVVTDTLIDKELAHIFLYEKMHTFEDFTLQEAEVSGIVRADFNEFLELWMGDRQFINIFGFELTKEGHKRCVDTSISRKNLVPHTTDFYKTVLSKIKEIIQ